MDRPTFSLSLCPLLLLLLLVLHASALPVRSEAGGRRYSVERSLAAQPQRLCSTAVVLAAVHGASFELRDGEAELPEGEGCSALVVAVSVDAAWLADEASGCRGRAQRTEKREGERERRTGHEDSQFQNVASVYWYALCDLRSALHSSYW